MISRMIPAERGVNALPFRQEKKKKRLHAGEALLRMAAGFQNDYVMKEGFT